MTTLFNIGPLQLTPYGLCILAGAVAGVLLCLRRKQVLPTLPWVILGALVLGHGFWVAFGSEAYAVETGTLGLFLQFWRGGYTLYGALLGGALGALLGARLNKLRPLEVLDALTPGACAAILCGRLGEYFSGQGFGNTVENEDFWFFPLAYCTYEDEGYQEWNYAVWFWEAVAALVLLALLLICFRKAKEGRQTVVFAVGLSTSQILLEQFRRDDFVRLNPFVRFTQIAAALVLAAVLVILFFRYRPGVKQILLSCAAYAAAIAAAVFAEFVFDKPQMTNLLYGSMIATAVLVAFLLAAARKKSGLMSAGLFALTTGMLLLLHALGDWTMNALLLYAMMALSMAAIGITVAVNLKGENA